MHDVKTKFGGYICFDATTFDITPEASNDKGMVLIPTVILDGAYTIEDLEAIAKEMKVHIQKLKKRKKEDSPERWRFSFAL